MSLNRLKLLKGFLNSTILSQKMSRLSRNIGNIITKIFGYRVAYICKYPIDKKAMLKELRKGIQINPIQKQRVSKIAILFIGTSRYIEFFPRYYETLKQYFLEKTPKDFFVFTDMIDFPFLKDKKDVIIIKTEHQKWPFSTLLRFRIINKVKNKLKKYSHIIFIDADMYVNSSVKEEEFFSHDKPLFAVKHDSYVNKPGEFEFNPISTASVSHNDDLSDYCVGAFWGGQRESLLKLLEILEKRIDQDLSKNYVAKWHDESHLNKYLIENKFDVHILDPSYAYPELKPMPPRFKKKVVHLLNSPIKKNTPGKKRTSGKD